MQRSLLTLICLLFPSFSLAAPSTDQPRLVVHLLDYLAKDYGGAVGDNGQVLSDGEYKEQVEFAQTARKTAGEYPALASDADLQRGMSELYLAIENKAPPAQVVVLARSLQQRAISLSQLEIAPTQWPDLTRAAQLFSSNCASCHGAGGAGDGPAGVTLDPKPANFLDQEAMAQAAPLGEFHTIRLGVPGTGMPSFVHFSDADAWSLAFYVVSLRYPSPAAEVKLEFNDALLKKAATLSDVQLQAELGAEAVPVIRTHTQALGKSNSLPLARKHLSQAAEAYGKGDFESARSQALQAYLEGIEPIEPRLRATDAALVVSLEEAMGGVREAIEARAPSLEQPLEAAQKAIDEAERALLGDAMDSRLAFLAAVGILLREGFEAALLIISLLTIINALGVRRAAWWVHFGWIAAIGVGIASWFLLGVLFDVSGAQRELLEGTTSLVAVFFLVVIGFWLHRHSEVHRWTRFLKEKVHAVIESRKLFGLAIISFITVFREAFETVLFLRVLWFEADSGAKTAMLSGTLATLLFVVLASWLILRFSARLPITRLFQISSYIMLALSFILTGKGIHALQESGLISEHSLPFTIRFELFGIFPSYETWIAQLLVLGIVISLWQRDKSERRARVAVQKSA